MNEMAVCLRQIKNHLAKYCNQSWKPFPKFKMELFVTIADSWKLLTSIANSLDPPLPNYDFHRTEDSCSNVNSLVAYVDGGRPLFVFIPNLKCNQDFNESILETLSMSEKSFKMLLNISGNVNPVASIVWGQPSILK